MRTLLVGTARHDAASPVIETEAVIVDTDYPELVRLELDDGRIVDLDRTELEAALRPAA